MSGGDVLTLEKLVNHETGSDEKRKLGWKGDEEPQLLKSLFVSFEMKVSERVRVREKEAQNLRVCVSASEREREKETENLCVSVCE